MDKFSVEKLNGRNWGLWKTKMEDYLYLNDLHLPLENNGEKPSSISEAKWETLDRKASATIRWCLEDSVFHLVACEKSAFGIWKKLEGIYAKNSATNKAFMMRRLINLKLKEGESIGEHLNKFQAVVNQLAGVGFKIDDETQALILMSSLPESWETLVVALNNSNSNGVVSMDTVVSSLLNEEMRRTNLTEEKDTEKEEKETIHPLDEVHLARSKRHSYRPNSDQDFICYYCERRGHQLKFCNKLKADKKRMNAQEEGKDKLEEDSDGEVNFGVSDEVLCVDERRKNTWVLDSGACFHTCNLRSAFIDYKEEASKVESANGENLHVQGIGSVRLKMDT